ncbi:NAD(P)/FAD-dependent oxidoreductase [Pygmaiobacter massiliensis]|uniref:NAD(P)/FAD-dependent oxidoreductase n=1 Tax=Pygmaiobacter massiliensis TaxID=1917873 RepID=UPI000C7D1FD2|nr:NAD(P)/FAD-dependent oxidoreductase [Pygmaiobacter massiliensis]
MVDVTVIGCGVIGAATAAMLAKYDLSVMVLEAQNDVATGTTKANSAIIHAGYDPEPETQMARLNVEGNRLCKEWAKQLDVPCKEIGSLVLAFDEADLAMINELYRRGVANGVPELKLLSAEELLAMEPKLSHEVKGALLAPSAAVISPWDFCLALAETAVKNGAQLKRSAPVTAIEKIEGGYRLHTPQGVVESRMVVNAAGVFADKVHDMIAPHAFTTHPSRGEYYLMDKSQGALVDHVVFQCPNKDGKGVLVSPTVHGNLIVGPNAEPVAEGDDVAVTADGLAFVRRQAAKSVPEINYRDSIRNFAGVRAVTDQPDFVIAEAEGAPGFIDLGGIKSPGLSSAPAIALQAVELLGKAGLTLKEKENYVFERRETRFKELSSDEKAKLVEKSPAYGRVICRCETITEGEIIAALHSPIPPVSVDGVKRRCNAGMGRCQGGFCGPRVQEIIARELGVPQTEVLQDKAGSRILLCKTKGEDAQ